MPIYPVKRLATFLLVAAWLWRWGGPAVHGQPPPPLKIVATTSLIAEIATELGGSAVEVIVLIPPASCPGHFDITPAHMRLLADAHILMLHQWQERMFNDGIVHASGSRTLRKAVLSVPGNWMTPPVQIEATDRLAAVLEEADPLHAGAYRDAAEKRKVAILETASAQAHRLGEAAVAGIPVLANDMQADFVRWAGFQVAGVFGRGEDMSPRDMEEAIRLGGSKAVRLVVDNLQSGKEAGIGIAREIGAAQVTLSNFPGGFRDTHSWAKAIEKNVDLILTAMGR